MRIAVFHELPVQSGSRKAVNEISKRLKRRNTVDLFIVGSKRNREESKFFSKIYFYRFLPVGWKGNSWKKRLRQDSIELFKLYLLNKRIALDIKKRNYNVIFIHGSQFVNSPFILRFNLWPKIYYAHAANYALVEDSVSEGLRNLNGFKLYYELLIRRIRNMLDSSSLKKANYIFSNSFYTKGEIKKIYNRESEVFYLGVDHKKFSPKAIKKNFDILFIGSMQETDGYSLLKKAVEKMGKIKIKALFIENEWVSSDAELALLYNQSKVVVCLAHKEPLGLVALEAMACGVPVVAVNEAGYRETIINRQTGYLIKRDKKELQRVLKLVLGDLRLRTNLGKKARQHIVNNWTWDLKVKLMEEEFLKITHE